MGEEQKEEKVRVSKGFLEEILEKIRVRSVKFREYSTAGKWYNSGDITVLQVDWFYGVN